MENLNMINSSYNSTKTADEFLDYGDLDLETEVKVSLLKSA
jgi:hypothetical protein